jgi:hypothetical protein
MIVPHGRSLCCAFFALKTEIHAREKQRGRRHNSSIQSSVFVLHHLDDARTLLQGDADLVLQVSGAVIAAQLAKRCLIQLMQNFAERSRIRITRRETFSVDLAERADQRVAVFFADFAILVAVASIEPWLFHDSLPWVRLTRFPKVRPGKTAGNAVTAPPGDLRPDHAARLRPLQRGSSRQNEARIAGNAYLQGSHVGPRE